MNITRTRGDTCADEITVTDINGDAVNLTGCTFLLTVSSIPNPPNTSTQLYQLTGSITAPLTGVVDFSPDTTQANRVGFFYYDIQLTDASGKIKTLASGEYNYIQDITK